MPAGRPTKRTPRVVERIMQALEAGMSRTGAAGAAGVDGHTLARWMDDSAEFAAAVREAEAKGTSHLEADIRLASKQDWKAAAFMLERRPASREDWGKRETVTHALDAELDAQIEAALAQMTGGAKAP